LDLSSDRCMVLGGLPQWQVSRIGLFDGLAGLRVDFEFGVVRRATSQRREAFGCAHYDPVRNT